MAVTSGETLRYFAAAGKEERSSHRRTVEFLGGWAQIIGSREGQDGFAWKRCEAGGLDFPGWEQAKQKLAQENTIDIALLLDGEV